MARPSPRQPCPAPARPITERPCRTRSTAMRLPGARHGPNLTTTPRDPSVVLACEGAPGTRPAPAASAYPLRTSLVVGHLFTPRTHLAPLRPASPSPGLNHEHRPSTSPQHASSTGLAAAPLYLCGLTARALGYPTDGGSSSAAHADYLPRAHDLSKDAQINLRGATPGR